jgi:periplasmic glucans biosynthesis protein
LIVTNRRSALTALLAVGASLSAAGARGDEANGWPREIPLGPAQPFSFEQLKRRADAIASQPYRPPRRAPAEVTEALDYETYYKITYRREATLWGNEPGDSGVRFFLVGRAAPQPVDIFVVQNGRARPVLYSPALFDMPADSPARRLGAAGGFAGFETDWLAFLGASYWRTSDPLHQYGLSARGLAIDTATAGPEEFPVFTAFWLEHDAANQLVVYALLESPSVTGAYRIVNRRSPAGLAQDIDTHLRFRKPVARLGVAPLTSMYWYNQSDRTPSNDWRPQIHDSDGLSIWTGSGERIWRPLADPPRILTNAFPDRSPRGFGLMQRDHNFADYQDDELWYDRRPSAWVEPLGDWGQGSVQLVEIPTDGETNDNIVAFWTPEAPVTAGQVMDLSYRLHWTAEEPTPLGVARVVATRVGRAVPRNFLTPPSPPPGRRKFVVDFSGGALDGLTRESGVQPVITLSTGAPINADASPVEGGGVWRLMFDAEIPAGRTLDMRAYLRRGGDALTETWIYQVPA